MWPLIDATNIIEAYECSSEVDVDEKSEHLDVVTFSRKVSLLKKTLDEQLMQCLEKLTQHRQQPSKPFTFEP
jgi:hypothetical protein